MERLRVQLQQSPATNGECLGTTAVMIGGMQAGQLYIAFMAWDRLEAILFYVRYLAKKHVRFAIKCAVFVTTYVSVSVGVMFVSVDIGAVPPICNAGAIWTRTYQVYWTAFILSIGLWVLAAYCIIAWNVLAKKAAALEATGGHHLNAAQLNATKTIAYILVFYMFFWLLPNIVYSVASWLGVPSSILGRLGPYIGIGALLNSSVNVFIYGLKHKTFKSCLKALYKCKSVAAAEIN